MSLDNIQLPSIILPGLYKNSLVDLETKIENTAVVENAGFVFLGDNKKQVAIIVNDADSIYLPDDDLNFLIGILAACKLSMGDVALINVAKTIPLSYSIIEEKLGAGTLLLFGTNPAQLQMPLQFPFYQVQKFNNQVYLAAPSLAAIAADKAEKTKLWNCLKQIFSIG